MTDFQILATDQAFADSPDAGDPVCMCSRCRQPIDANCILIRMWDPATGREWRYHPACLGLQVPAFDDDMLWGE